jgi:pimeloyl-ACP methyl ester carboxylesterase
MHGYEAILLHGAWTGPWVFGPWVAPFAEAGFAVRRLTLPGHAPGDDPAGCTLKGCDDFLASSLWEPERTVIAGYSLGGWATLKFLERHCVAATVLLAPLPPHGLPGHAVRRILRRAPGALLGGLLLRRPNHPKEAFIEELCFPEGADPKAVRRFAGRCLPVTPGMLAELALLSLRLPTGKAVCLRRIRKTQRGRRHLVVASEGDRLIQPADLGRTVEALGADTIFLRDAPHCMVETDQTRSLAAAVLRWLQEALSRPPAPSGD